MRWKSLIRSTTGRNGLIVGLLVGLAYGLSRALTYTLSYGLSRGLIYGLAYGLIGGLLSLLLSGRSARVQLVEQLTWSWGSLFSKRLASVTLGVTALIGLMYGLSVGLTYGGLIHGLVPALSIGPSVGLTYGLLLGLFRGVSSETIEDQRRVVPNQGIRRSALNGLVLGIISTLILGLSGTVSYELLVGLSTVLHLGPSIALSTALSTGLLAGLSIGLCVGLLAGLLNGGLACLRHWVLRFLLWHAGVIPWNYPRFLDVAAERILLRKVGGGYIFVHRLLLEYFATLDTTHTNTSAIAVKPQQTR